MTAFPVPDLAEVLAAHRRIAPYLPVTALYRYPALDALTGAQVWVKHENHQPVGAFKVRGGVNLVSQLGTDERRRGVIAASTGNHGQSVAYAAGLFGVLAVPHADSARAAAATLIATLDCVFMVVFLRSRRPPVGRAERAELATVAIALRSCCQSAQPGHHCATECGTALTPSQASQPSGFDGGDRDHSWLRTEFLGGFAAEQADEPVRPGLALHLGHPGGTSDLADQGHRNCSGPSEP